MIDDQAAIDNICATVTGGNLKYIRRSARSLRDDSALSS